MLAMCECGTQVSVAGGNSYDLNSDVTAGTHVCSAPKKRNPYWDYIGAALARTGSPLSERAGYRYYCRNVVWRMTYAD